MASVDVTPPLAPSPPWLRLLWPAAIAAAGFAALAVDLPIARWFHDGHCPAEIHRWLAFAEVYAHGFGVTCIVLTIFALDTGRRHLLPRAAAIAFGGGLIANLLKLSLARLRPHDFFLAIKADNALGPAPAGQALTHSIADTFGQWLPLGKVASGLQSFPSGHMATAFGLTAALIWLYPRGRWVFAFFALLAGCQRMSSQAHFLSDVVWGAAAGCTVAVLFLPTGLLAWQFDWLERRLQALNLGRAGNPTDADSPSIRPRQRDAA
jgi:membrane-associated phospholipid phosphatase